MQKSLAAKGGVVSVPDAFPVSRIDFDDSTNNTPYATFVSDKTKNLISLQAAIPGLSEPDVVLVNPKGPPVRLHPFRFSLVTGRQFWVDQDPNGQLIAVKYERSPKPYREFIESVVVAYVDGKAYPCRMTFKSTKCGAAKTALAALNQVIDSPEEWAKKSEAHRATLQAITPWMRYTVLVSCKRRVGSSGFDYYQALGTELPATPNDWVAVADFLKEDGSKDALESLALAYNARIAEVEAIAKKTR